MPGGHTKYQSSDNESGLFHVVNAMSEIPFQVSLLSRGLEQNIVENVTCTGITEH